VKYAWIERMAHEQPWWFSIALACELLEVSRSGFYDWRARRSRPATPAEREQQLLVAAITVEHIASKQRYGSPRIHAELVAQGWKIGVNRVARLMWLHGLEGRSGRRRRHNLTRQATIAPDIPDLLERDFTAEQPDTRWVSDISYVPTAQGWVYLAVLVDLCSKAVVGWAADTHMRTSLVLEALTMALAARAPSPGLIVHSDRGSQFTSREWLDALAEVDAWPSMGRVGVCWDNAAAESWFGGFKNELVHPIGAFATRHEAKVEIARYIRWHNTTRRHSALDMLAPHTWERAHTLTRAA
jgi:putative transposase